MTAHRHLFLALMTTMAATVPAMGQRAVIERKDTAASQAERTLSILDFLSGGEPAENPSAPDGDIVVDWGWLGTVDPLMEISPGALTFITEAVAEDGYYESGSSLPTTTRHIWPSSGNAPQRWSVAGSLASRRRGAVTSGFGWRERFGRHHNGIDIAMSVGDTVRIPMGGTVERIGFEAGGYGHFLVIRHPDGLETRYGHLSRTLSTAGEVVAAGQAVALSGNTGRSTGPHLHFEARFFGIPVDPETLFNFSGTTITPRTAGRNKK